MTFLTVPFTKGFSNTRQLHRHYAEHGLEFGAKTVIEYETFADTFLGAVKPPHVLECARSKGDVVRFDPTTDAYGVLDRSGIIRTYFKPLRCATVPAAQIAAMRLAGKCHDRTSNLEYFKVKCTKW